MPALSRGAGPSRLLRHFMACSGAAMLHWLLWVALTQRPAPLMTPPTTPRWPPRVTLRLLPLPLPVPAVPARAAAPMSQLSRETHAAQPPAAAPSRAVSPAATTATTAAAEPQPITLPAEPPQAMASPPPLDLRWRESERRASEGARNPALTDPRANTARSSRAERMARTLGSDTRLIEEARADGTVRVRQGSACVDLKRTRASQLFPFDPSIQQSPRLAEACD